MIVETSAIMAILNQEPEAEKLAEVIESARIIRISAATYLEAGMVVDSARDPVASRQLDNLLREMNARIEPITASQAFIARQAFRDFGRGSCHPAKLNFGDCFSYALSKDLGEPLLFKGNDFSETDVRKATANTY